jgi:lysophospholipase L1-like esterase
MIRLLLLFVVAINSTLAAPVALSEGEMVVFLGDTFMEREGTYGHIEANILANNPGKSLRFRNLAWSGNTPNEQARSYFGPPAEGQQRLKANLDLLKPTVVFCCYGSAVAADGEAALGNFIADYGKLIDLVQQCGAKQVVLISPPPAEGPKGSPLGQKLHPQNLREQLMMVRNDQLRVVGKAVGKLAGDRKLNFIDLNAELAGAVAGNVHGVLTYDGLHYTEAGYRALAPIVARALVASANSNQKPSEKLRTVVIAKNELWFNRHRPQNEIYLFGSRKHEQGNNGVEIPQFDPLIDAKDKEIAALNQAVRP